ncbi:hypothetical protein [Streptomyces sp. NPDC091371]|uniref:hypothetical protein n=1 Tax=Streptomyces sp. NPDC091371 TaxID=3155303 RepID=UPI003430C0A2
MTDTKSARPLAAGDGDWALPLLLLLPLVAIRQFADQSATPWTVVSWVLCALSAVFLAVGWATVSRHGMRNLWAWVACVAAHVGLAVHIIRLVLN